MAVTVCLFKEIRRWACVDGGGKEKAAENRKQEEMWGREVEGRRPGSEP